MRRSQAALLKLGAESAGGGTSPLLLLHQKQLDDALCSGQQSAYAAGQLWPLGDEHAAAVVGAGRRNFAVRGPKWMTDQQEQEEKWHGEILSDKCFLLVLWSQTLSSAFLL